MPKPQGKRPHSANMLTSASPLNRVDNFHQLPGILKAQSGPLDVPFSLRDPFARLLKGHDIPRNARDHL